MKLSVDWILFEQHALPLFFLAAVFELNFDWANLTFAALSLTLSKVILPFRLFPVFYAVVGVSGSQKGDNFWEIDRALIGPFDITAVSQYLWA